MVIPHPEVDIHALLTRAPLNPKVSFDLHVLGLPPAFVLSQDQTLKLTCIHPILKTSLSQPKDQMEHIKRLLHSTHSLVSQDAQNIGPSR